MCWQKTCIDAGTVRIHETDVRFETPESVNPQIPGSIYPQTITQPSASFRHHPSRHTSDIFHVSMYLYGLLTVKPLLSFHLFKPCPVYRRVIDMANYCYIFGILSFLCICKLFAYACHLPRIRHLTICGLQARVRRLKWRCQKLFSASPSVSSVSCFLREEIFSHPHDES
jgi:hypothetical protein